MCNNNFWNLCKNAGSKQCCSHSNLSVDAICEANLLLVLCFAPRGLISSCTPVLLTPQKSTFPNSNSTRMAVLTPTRYLFIYLFQLFISSFCCCLSYRALVKWIAPSVVTMKCVLQTTKITVYDVFVRLDIQEHLAVSYINIWLCHKLSVTRNSVMTKNVDPFSPSVLRVLYATGR